MVYQRRLDANANHMGAQKKRIEDLLADLEVSSTCLTSANDQPKIVTEERGKLRNDVSQAQIDLVLVLTALPHDVQSFPYSAVYLSYALFFFAFWIGEVLLLSRVEVWEVICPRAVAEYLSRHLPNKLSPDDVFLTLGCTHAIEVALSVLAHPGANILLPRPGYPYYEAMSSYIGLENRHFNLLPEKGWEVDLDAVEALADENTVAMVIINPGNPCGNVYTYEHLQKVAETAKKLGILVIADEVYEHLTFGNNPFVPMGVFGHTVPVLTLGSISKRWIVPGWRVGWLVTNDTQGILQESGLVESITSFLNISSDPATFIQGALPQIFENTNEEFFSKIKKTLGQGADLCYGEIKGIPCFTCPSKPEGSMFVMVKLNLCLLSDIQNDLDFCKKLAKEENMVILPGSAVGMKNWVRITFAVEPSTLEQGLERIKAFSLSHAK
ncbi:hypothetical protein SOVF_118560 [Spinacia oleracea]|nr:hypothetical protein SOVF_118560 [Spinacia oleracea]